MKKNKKVYLPNGEEAELLAQYKDDNRIEYVVKVIVGEHSYSGFDGEGGSEPIYIYENKIASSIYEKYEDIPMFLRKTELEGEVEELKKKVKELKEEETKLKRKLKSVYNPQFPIGTPIYWTGWGKEVEELKIVKIVFNFNEEEGENFYIYFLNKEYYSFREIGDCYYLTREEAEKARQEYLKNEEIENRKKIEEDYKKAKEEYEKIFGTKEENKIN